MRFLSGQIRLTGFTQEIKNPEIVWETGFLEPIFDFQGV
jgi:hypothetical protein